MNELRRRVGEGEIVVVIGQDATSDLAQTTFERASRISCIAVAARLVLPKQRAADVLNNSKDGREKKRYIAGSTQMLL